MRRRVLCLLAMAVAVAFCWLRSYEVLPTQASWSGWAPENGYVGNTFVANFDSITEVSLFCGTRGDTSHHYDLDVYDAQTNERVARQWDVAPAGDHTWLRFTSITPLGKFVRGRDYVVKFTRPNDSINWYKSSQNVYHYGQMVVGGTGLGHPPPQSSDDICARIYGKARVGDEFSMQSVVGFGDDGYHVGDTSGWRALIQSEVALGIKSDKLGYGFGWLNPDSSRVYNWGMMDSLVTHFADAGISMPVQVAPGPWAGCDYSGWHGGIARRLFEPLKVNGQINDSNLVGRFFYDFVRRYGPHGTFWSSQMTSIPYLPITLYESGSEPDQAALGRNGWGGYWQSSNIWFQQYKDTIDKYVGLFGDHEGRKRSFLWAYARYVVVMDSAIKMAAHDNGTPDESLPRSACYIISMPAGDPDRDTGEHYMPGEWIQGLKDHGAGDCFDIASYHPYRGRVEDAASFLVDTLRHYFSQTGLLSPRPFWCSEAGHFSYTHDPDQNDPSWPLKVIETYAITQNLNAMPAYPVEQWTWFTYTARIMKDGWTDTTHTWWQKQSITDSEFQPRPPAYAYKQWSDLCHGASFEGRIPPSSDPWDTIWDVRILQFRDSLDKRFWIAWQPWASGWYQWGPSTLKVPARADTESGCGVDTGGSSNAWAGPAAPSGWFNMQFDTFPVIVFEGQNFSRPDIVVDSMRMVPPTLGIGLPATAHVYFHNAGDTTPDWPAGHHYTYVILRHNGDSVAQALYDSQIPPGGTGSVSISVNSVPASWHGTGLFDATANYQQQYVELNGMDDNDGYSRNRVKWLAEVDSPYVVCGIHHNEPLVLLGFRTFSMERDTTGQTPCDSARLVQYWYGLNDTVLHAADTTPWFCVNRATTFDTSMQFLSGQGKYRLFVQVEDSWSMSDLIPDSAHSYVFFDTTGPGGSIVINGGARFATSSSCSLRLAAHDSASGVASMRFTNTPKVNLVQNGKFAGSASSWSFAGSGSGYDSTLQMAKLSVGSSQSSVRQFIPAESISAHSGDSCVLEANVMALMHGGNASGDVAFWCWKTRQDTSLHDTAWTLIDSGGYAGDLLSLTGRSNLSKHFLLTTPSAESGWSWRGGMVRVKAQGVDTAVGHVWTDDIALDVFHPQSGDAWFGSYDTLSQWDIGSGAGRHIVTALYRDSSGNENSATYADTIMLDATAPVVHIALPGIGQMISGLLDVTGWGYDPIVASGDTWFKVRRLQFRSIDSTNWRPVLPDSMSHVPAYPDSTSSLGPAVHLGYWSTISVANGMYQLRLSATDSAGQTSSCTTLVSVLNGGFGGGFCMGPDGGGTGMGEGSVYVGSATGTVLHLSSDLDSLDAFQVTDSSSQAYVTAVLEVGNDSLVVLDARNKRLHKLHKDGQRRRRLVSGLSLPMGLTKDGNDNLWLVDRGISRIGKFRPGGTLVFTRGGPGTDSLHFRSPEGIAVKGNLVYVADTKNDRIAVWDTSGNFKTTITGDFENPTAVFVTDAGAIYLTDGTDGKLKGITPLGGNIVNIGASDSSKLRGLVPSEDRHSLFSLAPQPNKVYKLRIQSDDTLHGGQQSAGKVNLPKTLSLAQPFPNPARTRLNIAYALPRQTRVELKLYDVAGKLVTTMANGEQKPGYYNLTWNRQDAKGRSCACGIYFCTLAAENQRFSRKVILTE